MAIGNVAQVAVESAIEEARRGVYETDNDNRGHSVDEPQRGEQHGSGTTFENRREGASALKNTEVATCSFIRLV